MGLEEKIRKDIVLINSKISSFKNKDEIIRHLKKKFDALTNFEKELAKWQKELDMVGKKLSNERFVANAKPEVVQKERDKQEDYKAKYDATVVRIEEMKKLVKQQLIKVF